jgi:hypothetical protein
MTLEGTRARGRAKAEARMEDTCRVTRPGEGERWLNPETGKYEDPAPVTVYEGPCRIPRRDSVTSDRVQAGETAFSVGQYPLDLPFSEPTAAHVKAGMTVTYLTAADNTELVGNVYGITEVADQSQATARRFTMKANR